MKRLGLFVGKSPVLPALVVLPFVVLMALYLTTVGVVLRAIGVATLSDLASRMLAVAGLPAAMGRNVLLTVGLEGLFAGALLLFGTLVSYNAAAWVSRHWRARPQMVVSGPIPLRPVRGAQVDSLQAQRIGIILAGGGAKGAYQAGALKAIYEFLELHGAVGKVKMIAGTSIGSWNAMFWLADLVKPDARGVSTHEEWWRSIAVNRVMDFDSYWPLRKNSFALATPWRELFREIFVQTPAVRARLAALFPEGSEHGAADRHFYFTRSNVGRGTLEFSTNWIVPKVAPNTYTAIGGLGLPDALQKMEDAVFASMDIPPLFPYAEIPDPVSKVPEYFEDGGVVDNLPISFGTQFENCDLLFVLPLNASYDARVNRTSIMRRLFRVMDERQGVIERDAFKMAYLYNELAALRNAVPPAAATRSPLVARALGRQHRPLGIFSICPDQPLEIGTAEFWKPAEAGAAFERMYAATRNELQSNFDAATDPTWIRVAVVAPNGSVRYVDDF
jgi:predicted acylesterase/phospholipase RssA